MSGIALTTTVPRGTDTVCDIQFIGINYDQGRVIVRLEYNQSGQMKDYVLGSGGLESIQALVAAVPQFAGLRTAMLQHLQALDATLAGNVT